MPFLCRMQLVRATKVSGRWTFCTIRNETQTNHMLPGRMSNDPSPRAERGISGLLSVGPFGVICQRVSQTVHMASLALRTPLVSIRGRRYLGASEPQGALAIICESKGRAMRRTERGGYIGATRTSGPQHPKEAEADPYEA